MLCTLAACSARPSRPPNVLLILVDTLRQDHLGCYGWWRNTSPKIDALAAKSIRFDRAYSTAPWTLPSVASVLTGLYPSSHGAVQLRTALPSTALTLAEILRARGYATAGVVSHSILTARWGFHQGYDTYLDTEARGHDYVSTPGVTTEAQSLVKQLAHRKRPFFLFVHYFDPHYEYKRHPEYGFAPPSAGRLRGNESIAKLREMRADLSQEEIQFIQDLYDEEIRFTDAGIGRLLATLKREGVYDDTLIVFVADHGEEFMAHGWIGHTRTLYDELVKVPLIVHPPRYRGGGRVVKEPVSLVSLTPTILDITGVDTEGLSFQGDSLAPLIAGGAENGHSIVFSEVDFIPLVGVYEEKLTHKKAITTKEFQLVRDQITGKEELYNLAADPAEQRDLAASRPRLLKALRGDLDSAIALARGRSADVDEMELTNEEVEKLRSLGYVH